MSTMAPKLYDALRSANLAVEAKSARRKLRFSPQLEEAYSQDTADWRRRHYRRSAILALLSYNVYLLIDNVVAPDVIGFSAVLHLLVVSPLMFLFAVVLSRPLPPRLTETIGLFMPLVFLAQVETVFLASRASSADHYQYLAVFALMFGTVILRLPFRSAAALSAIMLAVHGVVLFRYARIGTAESIMGIMTLASTAYITLLSGTFQEAAYRRTWINRRYAEMLNLELSRDNDKLSQLSRIDPLTGIKNRRGFDLAVERCIADERQRDRPFCVIMLDVDHFKSYNDTYGHGQGDECLRAVSQVMTEALRAERDVVGRFGGEEFVAFIPDCHITEGAMLAERIRRALVAAAIPHARADGGRVVTASLGVAEGRLSGIVALHDAIAHADIALYDAKRGGRNRVEPKPTRQRDTHGSDEPLRQVG